MHKIAFFYILLFSLCNYAELFSQNEKPVNDSLQIFRNDTIALKSSDTITNIPLLRHGSRFLLPYANVLTIEKKELQLINYFQPSEILKIRLPAYPLSLGSYGQFNHFSAFGGNPHDVWVSFNNRTLNDLEFGSYNLEQIQPEFLEKLEILFGSDAVIYGDNSSGALINIQEPRYNTKLPYTRIWYCQSGIQGIASDAIFSQNLFKNTNFTVGYRSLNDPGRYPNSSVDGWNIRGAFRWNPSNLSSISFVYNYTNFFLGTNGGVNQEASTNIFDPLYSKVNYEALAERNIRNDMTLTYTRYLDDSMHSAFSASLFWTRSFWRKDRDFDLVIIPFDSTLNIESISDNLGVIASYEQHLTDFITIRAGGSVNYYNVNQTDYQSQSTGVGISGYVHSNFSFSKDLNLSCGLRVSGKYDYLLYSIGGRLSANLSNNIEFFADFSLSEKAPSPVDVFSLIKEKNILSILGASWKADNLGLSLNLFARYVADPFVSERISDSLGKTLSTRTINGSDATVVGCYFNITTELFKNFHIDYFTQLHYSLFEGQESRLYPLFYGGISPYYEIFKGRSFLRLGLNFNLMTGFRGELFIPQTRRYVFSGYESGFFNNGIDVFLAAKLGSAFVRIAFENVLAQGYYYTPIYPELERILKISVSWSFMD